MFIVGRKFRILLRGRLTRPWIVTRHSPKTCSFRDSKDPNDQPRHLSWQRLEAEILAGNVRWHSSVPRRLWVSLEEIHRRSLASR